MSGTTMKYAAKGSKKGFGLGKALALVLSAAVVAGGVVGWNAHTAKEARLQAEAEAAAKAESASLVNQNGDLAMFNVLFSQTQEQVNKMHGLRLKLGKDDGDLDEKLKTAINALADAVRRCAE